MEINEKKLNEKFYSSTKHYQKIYGFDIGKGKHDTWNNEGDTFKHTFGSADTALKEGNFVSWAKGIYHETQTPNNPEGEKNMDNWNNNQGRLIAKEIKKKIQR